MTNPLPIDLKALLKAPITSLLAIAIFALLYLLYLYQTGLANDVKQVHAEHQAMPAIIDEQFARMRETISEKNHEQTRILQKVCVRLSQTREEANDCLTFEL